MAQRAGFLVKNAPDVGANLEIAEPDSLDFNLLGNQRFGVLQGCDVTVTGSSYVITVTNLAGGPSIYVVNGQVVAGGGQVTLPTASQASRFDLIVGDSAGHISAIVGTASPNPVFPAYDDKVCVFAAVEVRPGSTPPQSGDVTDKRVMLMQRFVSAITNGGPLLANQDPTPGNALATLFKIDPNGKIWWNSDTTLERTNPGELTVTSKLVVTDSVTIDDDLNITGDLNIAGDLVASNFSQGSGPPSGSAGHSNGDLYKNLTDGTVWVFQNGTWNQMAAVTIPAGMTMTSMRTDSLLPGGWLLMNGQVVDQPTAGGLWALYPSWQIDSTHLRLPDATGCFLAQGAPGVKGGNPSPMVTIGVANMPAHHHLVSPTTDAGGAHTHPGSTMTPAGNHAHTTGTMQGAHIHGINDPGHAHPPQPSGGGPNQFDVRVFAGPAGLQLGNQPYVQQDYTGVANTGIAITTESSNHVHSTDNPGDHIHLITVQTGGSAHSHPIQENTVGGGVPIDIRPPFFGMNVYIKT